ncbi:MAG: hypothetical protein IKX76_05910 [Eubacterium sp.]|nr:hypothetical protein [Eubacterium sp.]
MLSLQINDIRSFMSHLLTMESFDRFYFVEASIKMGISYHIDGHLNKDFYDTETRHSLTRNFSYWKEVRPRIFSLIKGKQPPLGCRIILALRESDLTRIRVSSGASFRDEDIEGMYLNILYDPESLKLTTGISYRVFSLDKSLDYAFEQDIRSFLTDLGIG